jgi:hypothetical protein
VPLSVRGFVRGLSWPLAALAVFVHIEFRASMFSFRTGLQCGLLCALAVLVAAHSQPRKLPALGLVIGWFYIAMGAPVFAPTALLGVHGPIRLSEHSYDLATLGTLIFATTVILVSPLGSRLGEIASPSVTRLLEWTGVYTPRDALATRVAAGLAVALYLVLAFSKGRQNVLGPFGFVALLASTPAIPMGLFLWDWERTGSPLVIGAFWVTLTIMGLGGLATGMLGAAAQPCFTACVLLWCFRGRVPWALMVTGVLLVVSLNSAKHTYRTLTWHRDTTATLQERVDGWLVAIEETYRDRDYVTTFAESAESSRSRLATLTQVAQIFEWVPFVVPHAGPDQWLTLPLEFVPRVLWRSKPQHAIEYNVRYTLTFGLQDKRTAATTNVTLPSVGDGFWRLGWLGVFIEACILGLVVGLYSGLAKGESRSLVIIGTAFATSVSPDQHVFVLLGGQPQFLFGLAFMMATISLLPTVLSGSNPFSRRQRTADTTKPSHG